MTRRLPPRSHSTRRRDFRSDPCRALGSLALVVAAAFGLARSAHAVAAPAEVVDLSNPAPQQPEPAAPVEEIPTIRVDLGATYSFSRSGYTTRRFAADGEIEYRYGRSEITSEFEVDREYLQESGTTASVSSDEYDANIKWKTWLTDNPFYAFWSPRVRYNRFGYYRTSQAMRVGLGRRFEPSRTVAVSLEVGPGVRAARPQTGGHVIEALYTVSGLVDLSLSETLTFKVGLVDERSTRENYRTFTASLRNRLTQRVWLKYEMGYRKALPFDAAPAPAESSFDAGLSYRF